MTKAFQQYKKRKRLCALVLILRSSIPLGAFIIGNLINRERTTGERLIRNLSVFEGLSHSRDFASQKSEEAVELLCRSCPGRPHIASVVEIRSRVHLLQQAMVQSTGVLFPIQLKVLLLARPAPGR